MSNMTKKLSQVQPYRPYKYNEIRRKFRMGTDHKRKDITSIEEEEFPNVLHVKRPTGGATANDTSTVVTPRDLIHAREKSNLVTTKNLGVSRENLGASQDSLNREDSVLSRNPLHASTESLRTELNTRQTSLDNLKKREENGRNLYTFTLQKADRSYSEPVLFPPLVETNKSKTSPPKHMYEGQGRDREIVLNPNRNRLLHKENTQMPLKDRKPPAGIKFPIVSRNDLYKHLGIVKDNRKRTKMEPGERMSREDYTSRLKNHQPKIQPESGGSRQAAVSSNPYGRAPESMTKQKVEMYKQWHEEQSKQKVIKKSKLAETTKDAVKLASAYREKFNAVDIRNTHHHRNKREGTLPKIGLRNANYHNDKVSRSNAPSRAENFNMKGTKVSTHANHRVESPPAAIPDELLKRVHSAKTWRTWRNINESYSYTDVQEYIEENELMDDEKEEWIKEWIYDVDRKYFNPTPESDEEEVKDDMSESQSRESEQSAAAAAQQSSIIIEKTEVITKL